MTTEDLLRQGRRQLRSAGIGKTQKKQTEVEIYNSCKEKYLRTKDHIKELEEKKKKLEDEISHLQQKQIDREKFLEEVRKRHEEN